MDGKTKYYIHGMTHEPNRANTHPDAEKNATNTRKWPKPWTDARKKLERKAADQPQNKQKRHHINPDQHKTHRLNGPLILHVKNRHTSNICENDANDYTARTMPIRRIDLRIIACIMLQIAITTPTTASKEGNGPNKETTEETPQKTYTRVQHAHM